MELQTRVAELTQANTRVFAISYDPIAMLDKFAREHDITYTLLSDEGSAVIRQLGLLNVHVAEQQAFAGRPVEPHHTGIPYPGLFVLDEAGVIVDKQFEQTHQPRPAPDLVLEQIVGADALQAGVSAEARGPHVQAVAWLAAQTYRPMQRLHLHVALDMGPDLHVYASPSAEGLVPLRVEVEPLEGLSVAAARYPKPHLLTAPLIGEPMLVHAGAVRVTIPLQFAANQGVATLKIRVSYQACSNTVCSPPESVDLTLDVQGLDNLRPEPRA